MKMKCSYRKMWANSQFLLPPFSFLCLWILIIMVLWRFPCYTGRNIRLSLFVEWISGSNTAVFNRYNIVNTALERQLRSSHGHRIRRCRRLCERKWKLYAMFMNLRCHVYTVISRETSLYWMPARISTYCYLETVRGSVQQKHLLPCVLFVYF